MQRERDVAFNSPTIDVSDDNKDIDALVTILEEQYVARGLIYDSIMGAH